MRIARVYPTDASFHPDGAQEEAVTGTLQDLFPEAGDVERRSFPVAKPVPGAPAGHVARFFVEVNDVPQGELDAEALARIGEALGCECRYAIEEVED